MYDKEFISKIHRELLKHNRKQTTWLKKCRKNLNTHFSKDNIQMANEHIRCSTSLIIWGMQIKTTVRYHPILIRMATVFKKTENNKYLMRMWREWNPCALLVEVWNVQPLWKVVCWFLKKLKIELPSVQFSHTVMSDSLQPHESQHARPPCLSPTPGVHSNSHPSSRWCHPVISSSVVPFSSCPQSLPASESFPMSQLFTWSGQSTGVSALASFLPKKSQGWSPSECTGWISLQSKGLSRVFSNTTAQKHQFFSAQPSQSNSHIHTWPLEKP